MMRYTKRNDYKPIEVHLLSNKKRDDKKKKKLLETLVKSQFATEFECEFVGSVDTLLNPSKIRTMSHNNPFIKSM